MYNRKRRPAERQLIKIMVTHLVTKARNMDEKEKNEEEEEAEERQPHSEEVSLCNSIQWEIKKKERGFKENKE